MTATDDRPARDAESADVVTVDVVVVGAGFNGLYQLKRLRDAGWSVRVVEAGDGLGHRRGRPHPVLALDPDRRAR